MLLDMIMKIKFMRFLIMNENSSSHGKLNTKNKFQKMKKYQRRDKYKLNLFIISNMKNIIGISSFFAKKSSMCFYLKMNIYNKLVKGIIIIKTYLGKL